MTINISSPNTQGLRDLQEEETLKRFIGTLRDAQEQLAAKHGARKPMLLKIAPDLAEAELDGDRRRAARERASMALICTNTTIGRAAVAGHAARRRKPADFRAGPLFDKSTAVLRGMAKRLGGRIPLVGVGGIVEGRDAAAKIDAGASLVQFYTGMVYRGPALIGECVEAIRAPHGAARRMINCDGRRRRATRSSRTRRSKDATRFA